MQYQQAKDAIAKLLCDKAEACHLNYMYPTPSVLNQQSTMPYKTVPLATFLNRLCAFIIEQTVPDEDRLPHLLTSFIYITRFIKYAPKVQFSQYSAHKVLIASLLTSHKFLVDVPWDNQNICNVFGIPIKAFNKVETEFLRMMRFNLYIKKTTYNRYYTWLSEYIKKQPQPSGMLPLVQVYPVETDTDKHLSVSPTQCPELPAEIQNPASSPLPPLFPELDMRYDTEQDNLTQPLESIALTDIHDMSLLTPADCAIATHIPMTAIKKPFSYHQKASVSDDVHATLLKRHHQNQTRLLSSPARPDQENAHHSNHIFAAGQSASLPAKTQKNLLPQFKALRTKGHGDYRRKRRKLVQPSNVDRTIKSTVH